MRWKLLHLDEKANQALVMPVIMVLVIAGSTSIVIGIRENTFTNTVVNDAVSLENLALQIEKQLDSTGSTSSGSKEWYTSPSEVNKLGFKFSEVLDEEIGESTGDYEATYCIDDLVISNLVLHETGSSDVEETKDKGGFLGGAESSSSESSETPGTTQYYATFDVYLNNDSFANPVDNEGIYYEIQATPFIVDPSNGTALVSTACVDNDTYKETIIEGAYSGQGIQDKISITTDLFLLPSTADKVILTANIAPLPYGAVGDSNWDNNIVAINVDLNMSYLLKVHF